MVLLIRLGAVCIFIKNNIHDHMLKSDFHGCQIFSHFFVAEIAWTDMLATSLRHKSIEIWKCSKMGLKIDPAINSETIRVMISAESH